MSSEADRFATRRMLLCGLAAGIAVGAAPTTGFSAAPAVLRGTGNYRSLSIVNNRTAETAKCVYWADGDYIPDALGVFDHILRDWRLDLVVPISRKTIDILAATHVLLDTSEPFEVVSGYRSPQTNSMLRRMNRGVAKNSYHTRAMAVDVSLKSRSPRRVAAAAISLNAGGVGKYSRSQFTHVDCGPQRVWGR